MYNVDTLALTMTFRRYTTGGLDWKYIYQVQEKITNKLVLYKKDRENRERERSFNNLSREGKNFLNRIIPKRTKRSKVYWHR